MTLAERVKQLQEIQAKLPDTLRDISKTATMRAVEKAAELTPPTQNDLSGTNTRTGELKARWEWDSTVEPMGFESGKYVTVLRNGAQYASFVNDGHRMDKHFVPGLYVNPYSGLLEYDPSAKTGIMVGTKTLYVPGLFMVDAAKEEYSRVVKTECKKLEDLFK